MNFSIALIARNESKTLPKLVSSLKEFQERGGEILLLDTGSTDNTAEVARDLGCIVHEVGEKFLRIITNEEAIAINQTFIVDGELPIVKEGDKLFDYASARNYIAGFASNDMLATPDCDEMYTKLDLDKIQTVIASGVEQLEYNFVFSHDEFGNEAIKFTHCKFYDRTKLKWEGIIHEILVGTAKKQFLDESVIKLEHWQNVETSRGHYLKGLALDCYLHPENDRNAHYFGRELLNEGRPLSAIKQLEKHISLNSFLAEKAQSQIFIGDAYGWLGNEEKQVEAYHKAIQMDGSRREAWMRLAWLYYRKGDAQRTASYAGAALEVPWNNYFANQHNQYTNEPHELMYWALWQLGDHEESKKHFYRAFAYQPENPKYLNDLIFYKKLPKVSILVPTLGRPEGLEKCLRSIDKLTYPKELVETIVLDGPDTVPVKVSKGLEQAQGEYVAYAANDMEFEPNSLVNAILEDEGKHGLVAFGGNEILPDKGNICEHFIIHKDLVGEIGGQIFDTRYHHVGVDNKLWAQASKLGKARRSEKAKVKHDHFSTNGKEMDEVNKIGWSHAEEDRELLKQDLAQLYA